MRINGHDIKMKFSTEKKCDMFIKKKVTREKMIGIEISMVKSTGAVEYADYIYAEG